MSKQYTHLKNYFNCFTADNVSPQRDGTVNYDYSSRNFKIKLHAQKSADAVKGAEQYLDKLVSQLREQFDDNPNYITDSQKKSKGFNAKTFTPEKNDYIESLADRIENAETSLAECKLEYQMYQDLHLELVGVPFVKWVAPSLDDQVVTTEAIKRGNDIINKYVIKS